MPTSSIEPVIDVVNLASYWEPKSVLDVGCGFGKYGFLLREYLDVAKGRVLPSEWKTRIDGIDAYSESHQFSLIKIYDNFTIYNLEDFNFDDSHFLDFYDLIILADVIEHLPKKQGYKEVDKLLKHCKHLILTTPIGYMKQDEFFTKRNRYEKHVSGWVPEDFKRYKKARIKFFSKVFLVRIDAK